MTSDYGKRPPHELRLLPVYLLGGAWVAAIVLNYVTGRAHRFELALMLYLCDFVFLWTMGRGMYAVFVFLAVPCVALGQLDSFQIAGITVEYTFLIPGILLGGYLMSGALKRYYPERAFLNRQFPLLPQLLVFLGICFVSSFTSHVLYPTQVWRAIGVIFLIPFLFYLYAFHAVERLKNVKEIIFVMVSLAAFYSSTMGIFQLIARSKYALIVRNFLITTPPAQVDSMWTFTYTESKIISVWSDAAIFGHFLCFCLPLAFGLLMTAKSARERAFGFSSVGLISFGILITGNRTDILGAGVSGLIILAGFWARSARLRSLTFKISFALLVILAVVLSSRKSSGLMRLIAPQEWDKHTASSRLILFQEGLRMFQSSPLFGVGLDNFRYNQIYRQDGFIIQQNYAHNFFVQILSETGLAGMLTYLFLLYSIFKFASLIWHCRTNSELDFFCFLFLTSCLTLIAQAFFENALSYTQTSAQFWLAVGIWRARAIELKHRLAY